MVSIVVVVVVDRKYSMFSRLNPERHVLDLGGLMSTQSTLVSTGHACGTKGDAAHASKRSAY